MKNPATAAAWLRNSVHTDGSTSDSDKPRHWGTVGLTEERLRLANKKAWMESSKGWSDFFARFTRSAKSRTR